jgi:cbb3-type cytochrome oxidase subunit 1
VNAVTADVVSHASPVEAVSTTYNDKVAQQFAVMTIVWGIVGMAVGAVIAAQLIWHDLSFGLPWLSYGRPRSAGRRM